MKTKINENDAITSIFNSELNRYDSIAQSNPTISNFNDKCKQIWSNWDETPSKENKKHQDRVKTEVNSDFTLKKSYDTSQASSTTSVFKTPNGCDHSEASPQISLLKSECDNLISRIHSLTGKFSSAPPANLKSPNQASYIPRNTNFLKSTQQNMFISTPVKDDTLYVPLTPIATPNVSEVERLRRENNDLKARLSVLKQQEANIQQKRIELETKLEQQEKMREFYKKTKK